MLLTRCLLILTVLLTAQARAFQTAIADKDSAYTEKEVTLDSSSNTLYGSLVVPVADTVLPVILIIPNAGPTDRNGNHPYGLSTDSYKMLSRDLAAKGIATLRYDKRGVGRSTPALIEEGLLSTGMYVADGEKWVQFLRKDRRFSRVIVLGHGEGALIGTLVANFQRADGFISLQGAGVRADSLIIDQITAHSPALGDTARSIISHIMKDEPFYVNRDLEALLRPSVTRYLKSWFSLSPVIEISLLRCPVAVIHGNTDLQVPVSQAKALASAKPGIKLVVVNQMNHVLKDAPPDFDPNLATYKNPGLPLSQGLVPAITSFVQSLK